MEIDGLFGLIIEPLLWALFIYFTLMTIVNSINKVNSKAKLYAITSSIIMFLIIISDDIKNILAIRFLN